MLAEFTLGSIHTQLLLMSDGGMNANVCLSECLLDDKRGHIKSVTSRYTHTHTHTVSMIVF